MGAEIKKIIPDSVPPECDEIDKFTALSLIKSGIKTGDDLMQKIGRARLRRLEKRETDEDLELLDS